MQKLVETGDIMHLVDGRSYAILNVKTVKGRRVCLTATTKEPIELQIMEIAINEKGNQMMRDYRGESYEDYEDALVELMKLPEEEI